MWRRRRSETRCEGGVDTNTSIHLFGAGTDACLSLPCVPDPTRMPRDATRCLPSPPHFPLTRLPIPPPSPSQHHLSTYTTADTLRPRHMMHPDPESKSRATKPSPGQARCGERRASGDADPAAFVLRASRGPRHLSRACSPGWRGYLRATYIRCSCPNSADIGFDLLSTRAGKKTRLRSQTRTKTKATRNQGKV